MVVFAVTLLVAWGALSFGAVYPWGSATVAAAVLVLAAGQWRPVRLRGLVGGACVLLVAAIGLQLVPMPPELLERVTPAGAAFLATFDVAFANGLASSHAISIDPVPTLRALGYVVLWMIWTATCASMLTRGMPMRLLVRNVAVVATAVAIIGLAQKATFNGKLLWFWKPDYYATNGFGPFVNRNHFAGWMVLALGLSAGLLFGYLGRSGVSACRGWRERVLWVGSPAASPVLITTAATLAMACSLVWTMSRSGIIAAGVLLTVLAVAVASFARGGVQRALVAGYVACTVLGLVAWRGLDTLFHWYGNTTTFEFRVQLWKDTLPALYEYWVTGSGLNTYATLMVIQPRTDMTVQPLQAHNDFLQLAVEGGLLVGIPALLLAAVVVHRIVRMLRAPQDDMTWWVRLGAAAAICGIAVQEISEFSLQIPGVTLLFGLCVAVAVHQPSATAARAQSRPRHQQGAPPVAA